MTSTLIISNILLWIAVLGLGLLVLSLARQLGEMQEQFSPGTPMMMATGLEVGEPAPEFELETLDGQSVAIGHANPAGRLNLYYFTSPDCPICLSMLGYIKDNHERKQELDVMVVGRGDSDVHRAFRERRPDITQGVPWAVSDDVVSAYGVERVPYAVITDAEGMICAHGLVNTREQLESLCEAAHLAEHAKSVSNASDAEEPGAAAS